MSKKIVPITQEDMEKIRDLIEGVEVDLDEALPEEEDDCEDDATGKPKFGSADSEE